LRHDRLVLAVRALLMGASAAHACPSAVTSAGDPGASGLDLRTAIGLANASSGCAITFDPSLNNSTITLHQGQINITAPMAIVGPGADKLTISGNNASRIFYAKPVSLQPVPLTISGMTLSGGTSSSYGGAIYAANLDLTLVVQNSVIIGNTANTGSALSAYAVASVLLDHVDIRSNGGVGGLGPAAAVFISQTPATIRHCTVANNTVRGMLASGIPTGSEVWIDDTVISGNSTTGYGAGIDAALSHGSLRVTNSVISGNTAAAGGGGVSLSYANATFTNVQIAHNSTGGIRGGGIFVRDDAPPSTDLTLVGSTVSNNYAYDFGAGIDVKNAVSVTIKQSLISRNSTTDYTTGANGGGIALHFVEGTTAIDNSTIYRNFAYNSGGGIAIFDAGTGNRTQITQTTISGNGTSDATGTSNGVLGAGKPLLFSCILANNLSSHGTSSQDLAGSFFATYTLVKNPGGAAITNNGGLITGQDPQLGLLAVNGGTTLTMLPMIGSPVINAGGNPASIMLTGMDRSMDQRGLPRPNSVADIGAVQRQYPEDVIFRNGFD
jgi:hypothetical protein